MIKDHTVSLGRKLSLVLFFLIPCILSAQVNPSAEQHRDTLFVKYKTVLEQYEADFVASTQERLRKKQQRQALIQFRETVIDTLPISNRLKRRLLKELYNTPFTEEWSRVLADLEFEDPLEDWEY